MCENGTRIMRARTWRKKRTVPEYENESEAYAAGEVRDSSGATAAVPTFTRYSGVDASDIEAEK